jgi:hypothetical protein
MLFRFNRGKPFAATQLKRKNRLSQSEGAVFWRWLRE